MEVNGALKANPKHALQELAIFQCVLAQGDQMAGYQDHTNCMG